MKLIEIENVKDYYFNDLGINDPKHAILSTKKCRGKSFRWMRYSIWKEHIYYRLQDEGKIIRKYLHVLVAEMFVPIPEEYKDVPREDLVVHHKDFNSLNNNPSNLQWMTRSEHQLLHMSLNPPMKGKHHSEESKKKISEHKKGQSTPHTEEWNRKIRESHKPKPVKQIDKKTGNIIAIYPSTKDAATALGILRSSIQNNLAGYTKSAGGYKWRYAD